MAGTMTKVVKTLNEFSDTCQKATIEALKEHLSQKLSEDYDQEFVDAVTTLLDEYTTNLPKTTSAMPKEAKEKKTRAPTAYNIFLKEKMAEIKASGTELKGKELMMAAVEEWNKHKTANGADNGAAMRKNPVALTSDSEPEQVVDDDDEPPMPTPSQKKKGGKK